MRREASQYFSFRLPAIAVDLCFSSPYTRFYSNLHLYLVYIHHNPHLYPVYPPPLRSMYLYSCFLFCTLRLSEISKLLNWDVSVSFFPRAVTNKCEPNANHYRWRLLFLL